MRISVYRLRPYAAACVMVCLIAPFGEAATARPRQTPQQTEAAPSVPAPGSSSNGENGKLATDPGRPAATSEESAPAQSPTGGRSPQTGAAQSGVTQSSPSQQQNSVAAPVGTAAAPYEKTLGVPASRPAGAVIAPAKQRRTRSILIRVGVILAAAGAVGAVVALSKASPSRP